MKNVLVISLLFAPCILWAQQAWEPPNGAIGKLDYFNLELSNGTLSAEITLVVDTRREASLGTGDIPFVGASTLFCQFAAIVGDDINQVLCLKDSRGKDEYKKNYFVEFSLQTIMAKDGQTQYTLKASTDGTNKAAVFCRLIDKLHPDLFINLSDGPYSFKSELNESKNRFRVRVYAACIWKGESESNIWSDADNWYGSIPGMDASARINNCAIIPEGAEIIIDKNITIGSLFNSGTITINEGVNVTIQGDTKLNSINNLY